MLMKKIKLEQNASWHKFISSKLERRLAKARSHENPILESRAAPPVILLVNCLNRVFSFYSVYRGGSKEFL